MIDFGIYQNGRRLFNNVQPRNIKLSRSRRGLESASCLLPIPLAQASRWMGAGGLSEVIITTSAGVVIGRGRIEDIGAATGGTTVQAFGYSRAMSDTPYIALWSHSGSADYRQVGDKELSFTSNERYATDNNNRLYMAVRKGNESVNTARARLVYNLPDRGDRAATSVTYTYDILGDTGAEYVLLVSGYDQNWTVTNSTSHTVTATPATATNTHTFTGSTTRVVFSWSRNSATPHEYTGETGEACRAIITGLRIRTLGTGAIYASDIAARLRQWVSSLNGHLVATDALVEATTRDLLSERYEDALPRNILEHLTDGDSEWGVDSHKQFYFRPRRVRRVWQVESSDLRLPYSIEAAKNSAYVVHRNEAGETLRTAGLDRQTAVDAFGLIRRVAVFDSTTSTATAEAIRAAFLDDQEANTIMADVGIRRVIAPGGRIGKMWEVEPGDVIRIINAPAYSQFVAQAFEFSVNRTEYDHERRLLRAEPDTPTRTLANLLAGIANPPTGAVGPAPGPL